MSEFVIFTILGIGLIVAAVLIFGGKRAYHRHYKEANVVVDQEVYQEEKVSVEAPAQTMTPETAGVEVTYVDAKVLTDLTNVADIPVLTDKVPAPKAMKPAVKAKTAPRVEKSTKPKAAPVAPAKKKKPKKSPKA